MSHIGFRVKIYPYNVFIPLLSSKHPHWGWAAWHCSQHVMCLDDRQLYETPFPLYISECVCVCVCACVPRPRPRYHRGHFCVEVPVTSGLCRCSEWGKGSLALLQQWTGLKHRRGNKTWQWGTTIPKKKKKSDKNCSKEQLITSKLLISQHTFVLFLPHNLAKMICSLSF